MMNSPEKFQINTIPIDDHVYFKKTPYNNMEPKRRRSRSRICCLLLSAITLMTSLFFLVCFINLFYSFKYSDTFDNVEIVTKYDLDNIELLLPSVDLKLTDKNIKFEHKLVPSVTEQMLKEDDDDNILNVFFETLSIFTKSLSNYMDYESKKDEFVKVNQNDKFKFKVQKTKAKSDSVKCYLVSVVNRLSKLRTNGDVESCVSLNGNSWFGGHESHDQPYWPINTQKFDYVPYVTGFTDDWGAVFERYWLSSNGVAIYIDEDIPLLVSHSDPSKICFKSSKDSEPYIYTSLYPTSDLKFTVCNGEDLKSLHMYMVDNYIGKPTKKPDALMMKYPIFTTWSYFFYDINQTNVLEYAKEINDHNYQISQLEIDDKWEKYYGDLDFDVSKFPNMKDLVSELHNMNMRVTLWVHPFCNVDSVNFVPGAANEYWIKDQDGNSGITKWWDGQVAAYVDFTNPNGYNYFDDKLNQIKQKYGVDSFKFDAGEASWAPKRFKYNDTKARPDALAQQYVKLAAGQSDFVEVRTAHRTQDVAIFYRILDRATDWTIHDGIKSVITATLQFGLLGYPFVLPDIIGGNGDVSKNNKELFIRWTQLTAFLPSMQFGVPPWYYDDETDKISKEYVDIHVNYIHPYIDSLPLDGQPYIRPVWWLEPKNSATFNISDQFLVGNDVLVAPVLEPGQQKRNVYFPIGRWNDIENNCYIDGPKNVMVNLDINKIPFYYSNDFINKFKIQPVDKQCSEPSKIN